MTTITIISGFTESPNQPKILFDKKPPTDFTQRKEIKIDIVQDGVIKDKAVDILVKAIKGDDMKEIIELIRNFDEVRNWDAEKLEFYINTNLDTSDLPENPVAMKRELIRRIKQVDPNAKEIQSSIFIDTDSDTESEDEEELWKSIYNSKGENPSKAEELRDILSRYDLNRYEIDIPYDVNPNFGTDEVNCVEDFLRKTYTYSTSKTNKVSSAKIKKHFKDCHTIQHTIDFLEANKFPYDIRDVTGLVIAKRTDSYGLKNKKMLCRFMVYNNHIYKCNTDGRVKNYVPSVLPNHDGKVIKLEDNDHDADEYYKLFNNSIINNYSYLSEKEMFPTAIFRSPDLLEGIYTTYDMKKCYYNILFSMCISDMNEDKIPVFTAVDLIEVYKNELIEDHFVYFVTKEGLDKLEPYGWNKSMLHGFNIKLMIKHNILTKEDISHVKEPSDYITVGDLRNRMDKVEDMLNLFDKSTKDSPKYFRLCNGLMGKRYSGYRRLIVKARTKDDIDLLKCNYEDKLTNITINQDEEVTELTLKRGNNRYLYFNSRSIYDYIVNRANYFVNQMQSEFERVGVKVYTIRTDSLQVKVKNVDKFERFMSENSILFKWFVREKQVRVEAGRPMVLPTINHIDVEKIIQETKLEIQENLKKVEVIQGKPGTGKTTLMKNTYDYDYAMTITNVCCRNMDTETVTAQTIRMGLEGKKEDESQERSLRKYKDSKIWLDEYSMYEPRIYNSIMHLSKIVESMKITGDINQIPPCNYGDLFIKRRSFFDIFLDNATILTKDYRNEPSLIEFRDAILNTDPDMSPEDVQELVKVRINQLKRSKVNMTKYLDTNTMKKTKVFTHIASLHKTCDYVNYMIVNELKLKADFENNDYSEGLLLKAGVTIRKLKIYNSSKWIIKSIDSNIVTLVSVTKDIKGDDIEVDFPKDKIKDAFALGYCSTVHSAQGSTIECAFCIHNAKKMYDWSPNILYTAITRGRSLDNIIMTDTNAPKTFDNSFQQRQRHEFSKWTKED